MRLRTLADYLLTAIYERSTDLYASGSKINRKALETK